MAYYTSVQASTGYRHAYFFTLFFLICLATPVDVIYGALNNTKQSPNTYAFTKNQAFVILTKKHSLSKHVRQKERYVTKRFMGNLTRKEIVCGCILPWGREK